VGIAGTVGSRDRSRGDAAIGYLPPRNRMTGHRTLACRLIGLAILAVACRPTPPRTNGAPAARADPAATPRPPVGITSRVFMPVCTLPGRLVGAAVCVDIATSPDRAAVHDTTAAALVRFFERTLGAR
jgi:hypothetical protein